MPSTRICRLPLSDLLGRYAKALRGARPFSPGARVALVSAIVLATGAVSASNNGEPERATWSVRASVNGPSGIAVTADQIATRAGIASRTGVSRGPSSDPKISPADRLRAEMTREDSDPGPVKSQAGPTRGAKVLAGFLLMLHQGRGF